MQPLDDPLDDAPPMDGGEEASAAHHVGDATRTGDSDLNDEVRRADDLWRHRQMEILLRIDENLRRLRQLAESRGEYLTTFTHPE